MKSPSNVSQKSLCTMHMFAMAPTSPLYNISSIARLPWAVPNHCFNVNCLRWLILNPQLLNIWLYSGSSGLLKHFIDVENILVSTLTSTSFYVLWGIDNLWKCHITLKSAFLLWCFDFFSTYRLLSLVKPYICLNGKLKTLNTLNKDINWI